MPARSRSCSALYRYHAVFTDSPLILVQAEKTHRAQAIIEQVHADLKHGPLCPLTLRVVPGQPLPARPDSRIRALFSKLLVHFALPSGWVHVSGKPRDFAERPNHERQRQDAYQGRQARDPQPLG